MFRRPKTKVLALVAMLAVAHSAVSGDPVPKSPTAPPRPSAPPQDACLERPGAEDHERGKRTILEVLNQTAYFKGDWVLAHGLVGTLLLSCDVADREAYKSLFWSLAAKSKLEACSDEPSAWALARLDANNIDFVPVKRKRSSFVGRPRSTASQRI